MNIAVYCSSSNNIADGYKKSAFALGEFIAQSGNVLVYGGGTGGLMDAVAEGATSKNGKIIGVIPESILRMKRQSALPTELIRVITLNERKERMLAMSDVFVILEGGYGTLDEMLDVITAGIVGEHKKPLILVNQNGFYNHFLEQIAFMKTHACIPENENYKPIIANDIEHCIELIKMKI